MLQHGIWLILASAWLLCSGAPGGGGGGKEEEEVKLRCDGKSVDDLVASALSVHNSKLTSGAQLALYQVLEATKVKNGSLATVTVHFTARESDCAAGSEKSWRECDYLQDSSKMLRHCHVKAVMEDPAQIFSLHCSVDPPVPRGHPPPCLGCPVKVDVESEDIMDPLSYSVNRANMMQDYTHHFLLNSIAWVTRQVIAGFRYRLQFDMQKSNCSKAMFTELTEDCHPDNENQEFFNCNSTVDVAPWRHELPETSVQCAPGPLMLKTIIRRRPPGWSPLRNVQSFAVEGKKKEEEEKNKKEGEEEEEEKEKKQQKESSEESRDGGGGVSEQTDPGSSVTPTAGPSPTSGPEATAAPLHCPSRPWKEFSPPPAPRPPPPAPRPMSDLDLADLLPSN